VDTNRSAMEVDVATTAITGGHEIYTAYYSGAAKNVADTAQGILGKIPLWYRQSSETGILTIAAIRSGATDADVLTGIKWDEIR